MEKNCLVKIKSQLHVMTYVRDSVILSQLY